MKSPRERSPEPRDELDTPSEIAEAFRPRPTRLEPPPGTFETLRGRAVARRRRRVLAVAAAVAVCLGGTTALVSLTLPGEETDAPPVASGDPAPTEDSPAPRTPPESPREAPPSQDTSDSPASPDSPDSAEHSATPPPAGELPICASGQLELGYGTPNGAAGSVNLPLEFTNTGEESCGMTGWPGVSLVGGEEGEMIGSPATRGEERGAATRVELAPGDTATADLRLTRAENYPAEDCDPTPARGLRVYPPDQRDALFLPFEGLTGCANEDVTLLAVTVVYETSGL